MVFYWTFLTTFFAMGFQTAAVSRTCGAYYRCQRKIGWIGFWVMVIGTAAAAVMVLLNEASVLLLSMLHYKHTGFSMLVCISRSWKLDYVL